MGSVLAYVFYWIVVIVTLVIMKHREVGNLVPVTSISTSLTSFLQGRSKFFGRESAAGQRRRALRERQAQAAAEPKHEHAAPGDLGAEQK